MVSCSANAVLCVVNVLRTSSYNMNSSIQCNLSIEDTPVLRTLTNVPNCAL